MPALETLLRAEDLAPRLPPGFEGSAEPWAAAAERLVDLGYGPGTEASCFFVPGRIEVLGKHTDYTGGRSLVAATRQGLYVVAVARDDAELRVQDLGRRRRARLDLGGELEAVAGHWTSYFATVARRLRADFQPRPRGADVAFSSTLPAAAGMSSSSALVVAAWLVLAGRDRVADSPSYRREIRGAEDLAGYLGAVEAGRGFRGFAAQDGVGTFGGSEDHTAILCSRAGSLSQYAYAPIRLERRLALPPGWTFAIAVSGVHAKKSGAAREAYNRAPLAAAALASAWRERTGREEPHLAAILASGPAALRELTDAARSAGSATHPAAELVARLKHFVAESQEIVPASGDALAAGDLLAFGRQVDRSQRLAVELLGNQTPETRALARIARELGAAAASAFGGGFGGAVWALVEEGKASAFIGGWRQRYLEDFAGRRAAARFLRSRPGPGAFEL